MYGMILYEFFYFCLVVLSYVVCVFMWLQEFGLGLNWISPVGRMMALSEG